MRAILRILSLVLAACLAGRLVSAECESKACLSTYQDFFDGQLRNYPNLDCFMNDPTCLTAFGPHVFEFATRTKIGAKTTGSLAESCRVTFPTNDNGNLASGQADPRAYFNISTFLPITGYERVRGRPERFGLVLALLLARHAPMKPLNQNFNVANCITIDENLDSGEGLAGSTTSVRNGAVYMITDQKPHHLLYGPNNSNYTIMANEYFLTPFHLNQVTPFAYDVRLSYNAPQETYGYLTRTIGNMRDHISSIHVLARIIYERGWKDLLIITDQSYETNLEDAKLFKEQIDKYGIRHTELTVSSTTLGEARNVMIAENIAETQQLQKKVIVYFCTEKVLNFILYVSHTRGVSGPGTVLFGIDNWARSKIKMVDPDRWVYTNVISFPGLYVVIPTINVSHPYYSEFLKQYSDHFCRYEDWYEIDMTKEHLGVYGVPKPANEFCLVETQDPANPIEKLEALYEHRVLHYSYELVRLIEQTIFRLRMNPDPYLCSFFTQNGDQDKCHERGCLVGSTENDGRTFICRPFDINENRVSYYKYFISPLDLAKQDAETKCTAHSFECKLSTENVPIFLFPPGGIRDAMRQSVLVYTDPTTQEQETIFEFVNNKSTKGKINKYTGERLTDYSIMNSRPSSSDPSVTVWSEVGRFNTTRFFENYQVNQGAELNLLTTESEKKSLTFLDARAENHLSNNNAASSGDYIESESYEGVFGDASTSYPFVDKDVYFQGNTPTYQDASCKRNFFASKTSLGGTERLGLSCLSCPSTFCSPGGSVSKCDPCEIVLKLSLPLRATILGVGAFFFVCVLAMAVYIYAMKGHPLIRASASSFLFTFLLGVGLGMASLSLHFLGMNRLVCTLRMWLQFTGLALVFGSLIIKNYRIAKIFSTKGSTKRIGLKDSRLFIYLGVIVLIAWILLAVWSGITKEFTQKGTTEQDYYDDVIPYCNFSKDEIYYVLISLLMLMVIVGVRISWQIRNTPMAFNEAKWVSFALYDLFLSTIIYLFLVEYVNVPLYLHLISASYHVLVFIGPSILLFAPKIYSIHFAEEDAEGKHTSSSMGGKTTTEYSDSNIDLNSETVSQAELLRKSQTRMNKSLEQFLHFRKVLSEKFSAEPKSDDQS